LLIVPFPESSLNEEAGRLFQENYQEYFKIAKLYTSIHSSSFNLESEPKINNNQLNENNNRTNIRSNEASFFLKDAIKVSVLSKHLLGEIFADPDFIPETKKHSKSVFINDKNAVAMIEEKLNLNNFYRANSMKVNQNNSKTKQEEIKKWLSRI
jgi:hypothetical protein